MSDYQEEVQNAAKGHWLSILETLAPALQPAIDKLGQKIPCPKPGCVGRFYIKKQNAKDNPFGVCNLCGFFHNGFDILKWITEESSEAHLAAIDEHLKKGEEANLQEGSLETSSENLSDNVITQRIEKT